MRNPGERYPFTGYSIYFYTLSWPYDWAASWKEHVITV